MLFLLLLSLFLPFLLSPFSFLFLTSVFSNLSFLLVCFYLSSFLHLHASSYPLSPVFFMPRLYLYCLLFLALVLPTFFFFLLCSHLDLYAFSRTYRFLHLFLPLFSCFPSSSSLCSTLLLLSLFLSFPFFYVIICNFILSLLFYFYFDYSFLFSLAFSLYLLSFCFILVLV